MSELRTPLILLLIGVAIYVTTAFLGAGPGGVVIAMLLVALQITIAVVLGIPALLITAKLVGVEFGYLQTAVVKLSAIFVFPSAVAALIPLTPIAWLVSLVLYLGLLSKLFDLEAGEAVVCAIVIWLVQLAAVFVGVAIALSLA